MSFWVYFGGSWHLSHLVFLSHLIFSRLLRTHYWTKRHRLMRFSTSTHVSRPVVPILRCRQSLRHPLRPHAGGQESLRRQGPPQSQARRSYPPRHWVVRSATGPMTDNIHMRIHL